jgi:hypothetical protein
LQWQSKVVDPFLPSLHLFLYIIELVLVQNLAEILIVERLAIMKQSYFTPNNNRLLYDTRRLLHGNRHLLHDKRRLLHIHRRLLHENNRLLYGNCRLLHDNHRLLLENRRLLHSNRRLLDTNRHLLQRTTNDYSNNPLPHRLLRLLFSMLGTWHSSNTKRSFTPARTQRTLISKGGGNFNPR